MIRQGIGSRRCSASVCCSPFSRRFVCLSGFILLGSVFHWKWLANCGHCLLILVQVPTVRLPMWAWLQFGQVRAWAACACGDGGCCDRYLFFLNLLVKRMTHKSIGERRRLLTDDGASEGQPCWLVLQSGIANLWMPVANPPSCLC